MLLAYYLSRPQASLGTIGSGGLSVLFCFLASFTLARCRSSVPNGYLNLTDARFARRLPWVLWAFSIPLTSVFLMPVAVSHHGRFGTGWGLALYVLTLVFPVLLTTVVAARCVPHTLELWWNRTEEDESDHGARFPDDGRQFRASGAVLDLDVDQQWRGRNSRRVRHCVPAAKRALPPIPLRRTGLPDVGTLIGHSMTVGR